MQRVEQKPLRTMRFTTRDRDAQAGFERSLGRTCNGWERKVNLHSLRETTPWWWRVLRRLSFGLLPDLWEWEARYTPTYSRWE
jgi:hypothetical protein